MKLSLNIGQVETFVGGVVVEDGEGTVITGTLAALGVTLVSSNEGVATVAYDENETVTITAISAGSADISGVFQGSNLGGALSVSVSAPTPVPAQLGWSGGSPNPVS